MTWRGRDLRTIGIVAASGVVGVLGTVALVVANAGSPAASESGAALTAAERAARTAEVAARVESAQQALEQAMERVTEAQVQGRSAQAMIRIHGDVGSDGRPAPLVYVDGVRMDRDAAAGDGSVGGPPLPAGLSPDMIERIEVFKGATAEGKYGAEGEHGVIEIFTKQAEGSN